MIHVTRMVRQGYGGWCGDFKLFGEKPKDLIKKNFVIIVPEDKTKCSRPTSMYLVMWIMIKIMFA